jgi:hypothetical protein
MIVGRAQLNQKHGFKVFVTFQRKTGERHRRLRGGGRAIQPIMAALSAV